MKIILDTCCGCIQLRTGCFILGYMSLVSHALNFLGGISNMLSTPDKQPQGYSGIDPKKYKEAAHDLHVFLYSYVAVIAVFLIFDFVFVIGLHQNKRGNIMTYLIFNVAYLILLTCGAIALAVYLKDAWWIIIVIYIPVFCLCLYFLLVIKSYYHAMGDTTRDRQPAIYSTS